MEHVYHVVMAVQVFHRYHSRMVDPVINDADKDRLLKHLSETLRESPFEVTTAQVCAAQLGLSFSQVRVALEHFKAKGWVKAQASGGSIEIHITPGGVEQARYLRTPKWRRWMNDRTIVVPIIVAVISALLALLLREGIPALWRLLFGPR